MVNWQLPKFRYAALYVWRRNVRVWRKLMLPSMFLHFGEPFLYLLGLGFGLGSFVGEMAGLPYLTFLASGLLASSAMNTASFEGLFSVYTRMVPQETYEGMLATPLDVDDIIAGEMLWCASKAIISRTAILIVAYLLGAINHIQALYCIPIFFIIGLCFAGPALLVAAISPSYDFFNFYITLVMTPMFIFCGVFYPTEGLPQFVQPIIQILPLTHSIALVRPLAVGSPITDILYHVTVLLLYAVVGFYFAVVMVRRRLIK